MSRRTGEEGQAAFLAAGLILIFVIMAAVTVDVGWWMHDKRDAQNAVDAAALAGARDLPDQSAASAAALTWATDNDVDPADLLPFEFDDRTGDGAADLIRVRVERDPGSLEEDLLNVPVTIRAKAAAGRMRAVAACTMPWGVIGDPSQGPLRGGHWGLVPGQFYGFHADDFLTPGNFGALAIYGPGAEEYKDAIRYPCGSQDADACDQTDPQVPVGETLQCDVGPANMGVNTRNMLILRDSDYGAGTRCNVTTYDEAVQTVQSDAACAAARAVLIPIIDAWPPHGHSAPVQIFGLATFYITGWADKPNKAPDMDGDTKGDMVWGYFLENVPVIPAWNIQWGYTDDPFAPINILLVE